MGPPCWFVQRLDIRLLTDAVAAMSDPLPAAVGTGDQESAHAEMWAAKLVLEIEPKWFREFWLCDLDPQGVARLEALKTEHETRKRKIEVLPGDFNETVYRILAAETIGEKTATFALLDQRTFE